MYLLSDVQRRLIQRKLHRSIAKDQDWQGYLTAAQLQCLLIVGNRQITGAQRLQLPSNGYGAMSIGIRFYHTQKPTPLRKVPGQGFIVVTKCIQVNLRPGSF